MPGPEPDTSRRFRPPSGLLGMLALVALVESFIAARGPVFRDTGDWNWAVTAKAARVEGPRREVLVFGDSLAKLGVAPSLVEARSGRSVYNLAVCAGQAPSSYFLLRRALDAGAKPKAILVDFFPRLLQVGPRETPLWPALLEPGEALELAWEARDADLFASITLARLLPSVRARLGVRHAILAALDGRGSSWGSDNPTYRRNWRTNLGAQIMPSHADPALDLAGKRRAFYGDLKFDPVNLAFQDRFLALAASRAIPVYYLVPPIHPGLQLECERSGFDAGYVQFLKGLQARYPNLTVIDGRKAAYDPALFHDPNHLGRDGAWAYSAALGEVLRRHPPGDTSSRWVELPRFAGLPAGQPPEDVDQSRAALAAEDRSTRKR